MDGSTHACSMHQCGGGVARNMAEALWRLRGGCTKLLTAIGDDNDGQYLANIAPGLFLDGCVVDGSTPTYAAVLDARGECKLGLGDMALHNCISIEMVNKHIEILEKSPLVILDGNPPQATIDYVLQLCHEMKKPVFFEPTDRRKAVKVLHQRHRVSYASPNLAELVAMATHLDPNYSLDCNTNITTNQIIDLAKVVTQMVDCLVITLGSKGALTVQSHNGDLSSEFYHTELLSEIKSVSGAGDCFSSGFIHGLLSGYHVKRSLTVAFQAAKCALLTENTVPRTFNTNSNITVKTNN